jgi:hypothetical protein
MVLIPFIRIKIVVHITTSLPEAYVGTKDFHIYYCLIPPDVFDETRNLCRLTDTTGSTDE